MSGGDGGFSTIAKVLVGAVAAVGIGIGFCLFYEADTSEYDKFATPQPITIPKTRVLSIELVGDPNETAPKAGAALFGAYFSLRNNSESKLFPTPPIRARWPLPYDTPRHKWIGRYALVVGPDTEMPPPPAAAASDAADAKSSEPTPTVEDWSYGDYAQILHVGSYATEEPAVDKLKSYVTNELKDSIELDSHEEEYLLTSGRFVPVDPARYRTLIRYKLKTQRTANSDSAAAKK